MVFVFSTGKIIAQSFEVQQLLLDWEKLTQMKHILSDMKTGYEVVSKGYTTIRDIARGNFNLHEAFLDGLWLVSPAVRKYWKIPAIIDKQLSLVSEYKTAWNNISKAGSFQPEEINYMETVYSHLLDQSLKSLNDLITILTAHQLRMSDDERLAGIDKIHSDLKEELVFLRKFNNNNSVLALQRTKEANDVKLMQQIYHLP
jgi:hypothetical protein